MYEKLLLLNTAGVQITPEAAKEMLRAYYEALNALDTTASALLIFNGVLVTAATFAAERMRVNRTLWLVAMLVIIIALVAAGLCLRVAHISYPFLDKVLVTSRTHPALDFSQEFVALNAEVALRTCLFQSAWWLSIGAVALSIVAILSTVGVEIRQFSMSRRRKPRR
jgi:hypothetical protein